MLADDQDDHPDVLLRHEGHLRKKTAKRAAVKGEQMAAIGSRLAAHPIGGVQDFPEPPRFTLDVGQGNGRFEGRGQDLSRKRLLSIVSAFVHQRRISCSSHGRGRGIGPKRNQRAIILTLCGQRIPVNQS